MTAVIGPIFANLIGKTMGSSGDPAEHFQAAGWFWAGAIVLAIAVSLALRETGARAMRTKA